jgi:Fe2+ or Zn2+ uptake regulation protein
MEGKHYHCDGCGVLISDQKKKIMRTIDVSYKSKAGMNIGRVELKLYGDLCMNCLRKAGESLVIALEARVKAQEYAIS